MTRKYNFVLFPFLFILPFFFPLMPFELPGNVASAETAMSATSTEEIEQIIASMTIEEKLTQMMFFSARTWKTNLFEQAKDIQELNEPIVDCLHNFHFGGVILFSENIHDPLQTLDFISQIQTESQLSGHIPLLVAADQEGGFITRIPYGTIGMSHMALTATGDPDCAKAAAQLIGNELSLLGINTDFAPVMDVITDPSNPAIGVRAFSDDPGVVAEYGAAYIQGLKNAGILSTAKHFPGHGNTDIDSHTGLPQINLSYEEILVSDLIPFKAAIEAGVDMIMSAHIQYPSIETGTCKSAATGEEIYLPATMSRTIITDILRNDLGFSGVVVSDALDMAAIAENYSMDDVLIHTINAGIDMLILPIIYKSENITQVEEMIRRAVQLTEEGKIDRAQIDNAVRRILTLKQKYGLLNARDYSVTDETKAAAIAGIDSDETRSQTEKLAAQSITLLKNENNAVPIHLQEGETALLLFTAASRIGNGRLAARQLQSAGMIPEGAEIQVMVIEPKTADACRSAADAADHLVIVSRAWTISCLDPSTEDGFSAGVALEILENAHSQGKTVTMISAQLPYDAALFEEADAIILTYSSSPVSDSPDSPYTPNLPMAICAAFGVGEMNGHLPLNIPRLDDLFQPSDEILFPREVGVTSSAVSEEDNTDVPISERVILGDEQFDAYLPLLEGKRVALFTNQTGIVGNKVSADLSSEDDLTLLPFGKDSAGNDVVYGEHILDALLARNVDVTAVFSPEHGFRGTASAGASVDDEVDPVTGVPLLSLYSGDSRYPSEAAMNQFDTLVIDIQDVGLRYYTYYISMYYLLDACAQNGKQVILLDRPNPNGFYVDGPLLEEKYRSGVGLLPIPIVHGMTLGELAQMISGEGWLSAGRDVLDLTVIPCRNYTHQAKSSLIIAPSPNLKDMRAVYLYASTCFFENTELSVGRGTDHPFEIFGSPYLSGVPGYTYTFTPVSMPGAQNPPFQDMLCYGKQLMEKSVDQIWQEGICLDYLVDAYHALNDAHPDISFFGSPDSSGRYWLDKLCGTDAVRKMIIEGKTATEIKESWQDDIATFRTQRKPYLLYPDTDSR